jgi:L-amino acid N-acyltransferase YncA
MRVVDLPAVRRIHLAGIRAGDATFETAAPRTLVLQWRWLVTCARRPWSPRRARTAGRPLPKRWPAGRWLPGHRWVAELDGEVAGWSALAAVSGRACYRGVAETSVYVAEPARGRGVGTALLRHTMAAADAAGLWTLQAAIFPENGVSLALHRAAGFRTVGVRERIGHLGGRWRDTVLLERRRPD